METYDRVEEQLRQLLGRNPNPHSPEARADIERKLLPMIRVAMRSGRGPRPVVNWIESLREKAVSSMTETWDLQKLASVLCEWVLEKLYPRAARETVIGS